MPQSINFDFTARSGLADNYHGDVGSSSSQPNRRYLVREGQIADGLCNPVRVKGYLSPTNNTFKTLTDSFNANIISHTYDSVNDDLYLVESGDVIWRLDGLSDNTFSTEITLSQSGTTVLTDAEMYQIYGKRCLFYSYEETDAASK